MDLSLYVFVFSPSSPTTDEKGANVNSTPASEANRTLWPVTGGSIRLHVTHTWALTYVNLGLAAGADGNNTVASYNASLLAAYNQTGNGTFCLPSVGRAALEELAREAGVDGGVDGLSGRNASLQVIQIGHGGSALYNVGLPSICGMTDLTD